MYLIALYHCWITELMYLIALYRRWITELMYLIALYHCWITELTLRPLMSYIYIYIYGALILDVSRSHTTTQHSR